MTYVNLIQYKENQEIIYPYLLSYALKLFPFSDIHIPKICTGTGIGLHVIYQQEVDTPGGDE